MPISIKINPRLTLTLPANTPPEIFKAASFWLCECPNRCGNCKSENTAPKSRQTSKGIYNEILCLDCKWTFPVHQNKPEKGGGLYVKWDDAWKPPYQGGEGGGEQSYQPTSTAPESDDSDVPY